MKDGENEQETLSLRQFQTLLCERIRFHRSTSRTCGSPVAFLANNQSLNLGIGDDAAVVRSSPRKDTVVTADLLVEDIDFRRNTAPAYLLGHKALAVSLSDIAAMGARPRWSLVSIGVPDDVWQSEFANDFYEGLLHLAGQYDVQLIGGDTSRTPEQIVIDSIVVGECAIDRAIKRSGAKPGDQIFVTGSLGGAAGGLRLIERGAHLADQNFSANETQAFDHLLLRHFDRNHASVGELCWARNNWPPR